MWISFNNADNRNVDFFTKSTFFSETLSCGRMCTILQGDYTSGLFGLTLYFEFYLVSLPPPPKKKQKTITMFHLIQNKTLLFNYQFFL